MQLAIPQHRDPVARAALVACALALVWLAISSALPPAQAEQPQTIILVATPTLPASQPTAAAPVPAPGIAAATAVPATAVPAPADPVAARPSSQLVRHADGAVSLPGSEAWMQPEPQPNAAAADPQLAIERAAAEAYRMLPTAAPPSAENAQPVRVKRPHTGR